MNKLIRLDKKRKGGMPLYQYTLRLSQTAPFFLKKIMGLLHRYIQFFYGVEIPVATQIGKGLFIGHPYCITINPRAILGDNCNIHKGLTIGQENRGRKKGAPKIGNSVWIGVNVTIVGNITIGDDVLIAPNSFVNCDIPSHSVVFGNPCIIKPKPDATLDYVNNKV